MTTHLHATVEETRAAEGGSDAGDDASRMRRRLSAIAAERKRLDLEAKGLRAALASRGQAPADSDPATCGYARALRGEHVPGLAEAHARFHALDPIVDWTREYQEAHDAYVLVAFGSLDRKVIRRAQEAMVRTVGIVPFQRDGIGVDGSPQGQRRSTIAKQESFGLRGD
jgi:hypothetical protein